ncbi:aminotransferase class IV [Paracoccus sp. Z330]|uniref:Probable branched-chain-amino-acid aminotransferase n=1 Tax=Paracoccus onchidii TaxID=3017813 RepID=A0ABT4ZHU2_9RHOB|nr:aminotransferase class IV [Paracoccus onchidii]MDB6178819.1 aminotransferase class IV [Paracoccus onchidii]
MRGEPDGSIRLLDLHLARLQHGCSSVDFPLDMADLHAAIAANPWTCLSRVRLTVDITGRIEISVQPLPDNPPVWHVAISSHRLNSADPWLRIKSSQRPVYDAARRDMDGNIHEVLLLNEHGEICEGSITNLFVCRGDEFLTPPVRCGLLPGVLRQSLLRRGLVREAVLRPEDLQAGFYVGNALRGLIAAKLHS